MIYKRVCRDCPIPGCGAKYLVKLANHLADVHQLDHTQRKKYLQEAKLQPKVKVVISDTEKSKRSGVCSASETTSASTQQEQHHTAYHLSTPRKPKAFPRLKASGVGKKQKPSKDETFTSSLVHLLISGGQYTLNKTIFPYDDM